MKPVKFLKIEGIKEIQRYKLPHPETIFIFDFKKQEKEIDDFLKDKKIITIRSDREGATDFCPNYLRCPRGRVKQFVKKITTKRFAAILQQYIPIKKNRIISGNVLTFKNHLLMELMGPGPLTLLNREGRIDEGVKFRKDRFRQVEHFGKRLVKQKALRKIANMVKSIPSHKILEFTLMSEGIYFWQIKDDKTAQKLDIFSI